MLYKRLRAALAVLAVTIPVWIPAPPAAASHRAGQPYITYYSRGVMGRVASVRRAQGYRIPVLPETGYIALTGVGSCHHIGEVRWLSIRGGPWLRKIVVDCSAPRDAQRHTNNRLIAEVAYDTARAYGFAGEGHARAAISR